MSIKQIQSFMWGFITLFTVCNIALGFFNISMLKDKRHYTFFNTDSNCNFLDPGSVDYQQLVLAPDVVTKKK